MATKDVKENRHLYIGGSDIAKVMGLSRWGTPLSLWAEKTGKPTRDLLANSINHPNDFGVRLYAQTILKTLIG